MVACNNKGKGVAPLWKTLITILKGGANPSLRYHRGTKLVANLALQIERIFQEDAYSANEIATVLSLIEHHDYRLVADYAEARRTCNRSILSLYDRLTMTTDPIAIGRLRYQLAKARFSTVSGSPPVSDLAFVPSVDELFLHTDPRIMMYIANPSLKPALMVLLEDVGGMLSSFIEQQFDVPGLNALVRQGVVRTWTLPDGHAVISKRTNPHKPNRFREEQLNCLAVMSKVGGASGLCIGQTQYGADINLRVVHPFAVIWDGHSGWCYALSTRIDGVTIEDLLAQEHDQAIRRTYLSHFRLILDALYELGILWGDMSTRNIIAKHEANATTYYILDFEKTRCVNGSISIEGRRDHCRGQIVVEELSNSCTLDEIKECLHGYFDPDEWDYSSEEANIGFPPREEVLNILSQRSIAFVTTGQYNHADREILSIRIPYANPMTKERVFPGYLGFKTEHYLSCASYDTGRYYEDSITGILITAKSYGCLLGAVSLLTNVTDLVECAFVEAEFQNVLDGRKAWRVYPNEQAICTLTDTIDALYRLRYDKEAFIVMCSGTKDVSLVAEAVSNTSSSNSSPPCGEVLACRRVAP